jgi:hypothetical protein
MIYDYLIFEDLIETRGQRGVIRFFGLTNVSRASRALRHEFLSYLLSTTKLHTTFEWLPRLIAAFSGLLHVCESFVVLLFDPIETKKPVDLLPVLELVLQIPLLSLRFQLSSLTCCSHPQATTIASDLNHLLQSCRTNKALNGRVLLSVVFHSDKHISHVYPNSNMNTRIQIRFKKPFRQLWMDGTHSFDELQDFFIVTGLDAFTAIDVWVGVASMRACGKGLQTQSQMQEIAYVQGRTVSIDTPT